MNRTNPIATGVQNRNARLLEQDIRIRELERALELERNRNIPSADIAAIFRLFDVASMGELRALASQLAKIQNERDAANATAAGLAVQIAEQQAALTAAPTSLATNTSVAVATPVVLNQFSQNQSHNTIPSLVVPQNSAVASKLL